MPHTDESREQMLRHVYTFGQLELGLARDTPDDEETDQGYRRVRLFMGEPGSNEDGSISVANPEPVQLAPYANDARKPVKYWVIFSAEKRLTYDRITKVGSDEPRPISPAQGEAPIFPAGALKVGLR